MRSILISIVLFSFFNSKSQLLLKLYTDTMIGYTYSGGDEFNSKKLGDEWNPSPWPRVIMPQDLAFTRDKIHLEEGLIKFEAVKEDSTYVMADIEIDSSFIKRKGITLVQNKFLTNYTAGLIYSKKKYHYGLYELRFKVEEGKGIWPAFWFYGGNKNEEIDAFELKGEQNNKIHVDTHCPSGCDRNYNNHKIFNKNWGGWLPITGFLHDGFNIMHLEWKPNEIIWYINGHPLAYFKGSLPNPMNLYLNTSVAKDGEAFKPGPDESTTWPNNYYCDYLRIWQNITDSSKSVLQLKVNSNTSLSDKYPSSYETKPKKKRGLMYKKSELNPVKGMITLNRVTKNDVIVNTIGISKKTKGVVIIKGVTSGESTTIASFKKEVLIHLNDNDRVIQIYFKTKKKIIFQLVEIPE